MFKKRVILISRKKLSYTGNYNDLVRKWFMRTAVIFDGNTLAKKIKDEAKSKLTHYLSDHQHRPCVAMVQMGENLATKKYLQCQSKNCNEIGIETVECFFAETLSEQEITQGIHQLNQNKDIDAILVGLPLPKHLANTPILDQITPMKDIDCITSFNQGGIIHGTAKFNSSCCLAVLRILDAMKISLQGKNALVIGSSLGKLIGLNLLMKNCTVTICNEFTHNIPYYSKIADIVIAVTGVPHLVKKDWLHERCILIDVGICHLADGRIVGDVDFESAKHHVAQITPVPGGVGPVTSAMLLHNIMAAALYNRS